MPKMIGKGSIYVDKKTNKWKVQYLIENDDLSRKRYSFYADTKKEAYSKLSEIRLDFRQRTPIIAEGVTLVDLLNNFREMKYKANIIGESQYYKLQFDINRIKNLNFGTKKISDITPNDIEEFLYYLNDNYSASTLEHTYQLINSGMNYAQKQKYILENPCDLIMKPKYKRKQKKIESLTLEEQKKLSTYLQTTPLSKEKYKTVLLIQLYAGLRIGEALALKKEDIDLKNRKININKTLAVDKDGYTIIKEDTKTGAGKRTVPISNFLIPYIKEQLEEADKNPYQLLFYNNHLVKHSSVNSVFKRICNNLEIYKRDLSTHVLRHTFGTRCIEGGMPPVVLQRLMGHTDIKVTLNIYTSILPEYKEKEIDKIEKYYTDNNLLLNEVNLLETKNKKNSQKIEKNYAEEYLR